MLQRDVVLVVQKDDHSLGYFDFVSGEELRRVSLPPYPHEFIVSADGQFAYCCHFGLKLAEDKGPGGDEVSVVHIATGVHVRSIHCNGWRRPHGITFDVAGRLYVLSEGSSLLLVVPDPLTGAIQRVLPTGGVGSHIVSVTRDGTRAFCSNMFSDTLSLLFPQENDSLPLVLKVGKRPEGSAFDSNEKRILICNRESSNLSVIDAVGAEVVDQIKTPPGPVRIVHWRGAEFCVALYHDQSIVVVDAGRGEVVCRAALPAKPVSIGLDRKSGLALAGLLPSGMAVVDLDAAQVVRTIATRPGPDPMVVLPLAL